jgi:HK97 family phage portal protein
VIVQSYGQLQALSPTPPAWQGGHGGGSLDLYGAGRASYGEIYRTQPNIRIGVDFVARNIAMLGLHVFRRVSDTDRVRLADHELAQWIAHPNPWTTRYRLIESLLCDIGTYNNAYWLKVRMAPGSVQRLGFLRIPPAEMSAAGGLYPTAYIWTAPNGRKQDFDPSEFVYFGGYDPDSPLSGLSMLYTMRRILAEEAASGDYRQSLWTNSSRHEGVIERPVTAPKWSPAQKADWRRQWQEAYSSGGSRPGSVAVLEDGMQWKDISWSAKESEYVAARKLGREYCAASQHIPQPFVGILDHATFSNIREQHKNLYQDTLGPPLEMIQQEFERQILPECDDTTDIYVEFNIDAKMAGTPEERAQSIQLSTGRPWRTVNEARALENMPRIDDKELDTVAPQQGGPAAAAPNPGEPPVPFTPTPKPAPKAGDVIAPIVQAMQARLKTRLDKEPTALDRLVAFEPTRWARELTEDLTPLVGAEQAGTEAARVVARELIRLEGEAFHG